jgi:hypothetical protein
LETSQVVADRLGIVPGDAFGGQAHGLNGAPADLLVRIERQGHETSQDAFLPDGHFGNLFEVPSVEQFPEGLLERHTCNERSPFRLQI